MVYLSTEYPEPLKGKIRSALTDDSDLHPELVLDLDDVKSAVKWLKQSIDPITFISGMQKKAIYNKIDEAFADVIDKE